MSLYKDLEEETVKLKRNLFKLLGVAEFAENTEFHDPTLTHVLPDLICTLCNKTRDADLLRDPMFASKIWECPSCKAPYNKSMVEHILVDTVKKRISSYQVQDLKCLKCNSIKEDNASLTCTKCSGNYVTIEQTSAFFKSMQAFLVIAKFHGFESLEAIAEWAVKL